MDNVNLVVAENLKNIRIGKGWSQSFVANQLGIAQRTISRAECGCGCSDRTLRLLANMYQVHISSLYEIKKVDEKKYLDIVPANVFSTFNVEKEGKIIYLPIYMSYLLKEPKIDQLIVDLDISGL